MRSEKNNSKSLRLLLTTWTLSSSCLKKTTSSSHTVASLVVPRYSSVAFQGVSHISLTANKNLFWPYDSHHLILIMCRWDYSSLFCQYSIWCVELVYSTSLNGLIIESTWYWLLYSNLFHYCVSGPRKYLIFRSLQFWSELGNYCVEYLCHF